MPLLESPAGPMPALTASQSIGLFVV